MYRLYGQASALLHGRKGRLQLPSLSIRLGWAKNDRDPIIAVAEPITRYPAINQALHVAAKGFGQALILKARKSQHPAIIRTQCNVKPGVSYLADSLVTP